MYFLKLGKHYVMIRVKHKSIFGFPASRKQNGVTLKGELLNHIVSELHIVNVQNHVVIMFIRK